MQGPATADGHLGVAGHAVTNEQANVRAPLGLHGVKRLSPSGRALCATMDTLSGRRAQCGPEPES
jgi:hypothetical protein